MALSPNDLIVRILGDATSLNAAMREADEQTQKSFGSIAQKAQGAGIAFAGIALASGLAVKSMLDQAGQMETYRTKLTTVFKDSEKAAETMQRAIEFAAKTPFEVSGIVDATVQLSIYRQNAEQILPLVGDLAAAMGARIEDTATAVGKAMSGSLEGWEQLRNTYGVTIERLKAFGAAIDGQGQMLTKNSADLDRNRKALLAVIETDFGGGMERQSKTFTGAMSNLQDSINNLKVSIGETLIPMATKAAQAITGIVSAVQKAPEQLKAFVGYGLASAAALGSIGAAAAGIITILPAFIAGLNTVKNLMPGLTVGAIAGWTALIAVIALAVSRINEEAVELRKAYEAQGDLVKAQADQVQKSKEAHEWYGKNAAALREMGVTSKDVADAVGGLEQQIQLAEKAGNEGLLQKLLQQKDELRQLGIELSEYNKKLDLAKTTADENLKLITHNYKLGQANLKELLAAEEQKLAAMRTSGATQDEIWGKEEDVHKLRQQAIKQDEDAQHKAAEKEKKDAEDVRKAHEKNVDDKLKASLHFIDRKKSLNEMSVTDEINALNRVLRTHELNADQRKDIIERIEDIAQKRSADTRAKQIADAEDAKKKQVEAAEAVKKARVDAAEAAAKAMTASYNAEVKAAIASAGGVIEAEFEKLEAIEKVIEARRISYSGAAARYETAAKELAKPGLSEADRTKYEGIREETRGGYEQFKAAKESEVQLEGEIASRKKDIFARNLKEQYTEQKQKNDELLNDTEQSFAKQGDAALRFAGWTQDYLDWLEVLKTKYPEQATAINQMIAGVREDLKELEKDIVSFGKKQEYEMDQGMKSYRKEVGLPEAPPSSAPESKPVPKAGSPTGSVRPQGLAGMGPMKAVESGPAPPSPGESTSASADVTYKNPAGGVTIGTGGGWHEAQTRKEEERVRTEQDAAKAKKEAADEDKKSAKTFADAANELRQGFAAANQAIGALFGTAFGFGGSVGPMGSGGYGQMGSPIERGMSGQTVMGGTLGGAKSVDWNKGEQGRWIDEAEYRRLMNTPGWVESGNVGVRRGGRVWVTSGYGQKIPDEGQGGGGFGQPIRMTANIEHVPGSGSPFDVRTPSAGGSDVFQGRSGPTASTGAPAKAPPIQKFETTINVTPYADPSILGQAIADKVTSIGSLGAMPWGVQSQFSS